MNRLLFLNFNNKVATELIKPAAPFNPVSRGAGRDWPAHLLKAPTNNHARLGSNPECGSCHVLLKTSRILYLLLPCHVSAQ